MGIKWAYVVHALRKWLASFAAGDVIFAAVVSFRCIVGVDKFPLQISAKWLEIDGKTQLFPLCVDAYAMLCPGGEDEDICW